MNTHTCVYPSTETYGMLSLPRSNLARKVSMSPQSSL